MGVNVHVLLVSAIVVRSWRQTLGYFLLTEGERSNVLPVRWAALRYYVLMYVYFTLDISTIPIIHIRKLGCILPHHAGCHRGSLKPTCQTTWRERERVAPHNSKQL